MVAYRAAMLYNTAARSNVSEGNDTAASVSEKGGGKGR
jgi:hypothetical protein